METTGFHWAGAPTHIAELARAGTDSPERTYLIVDDAHYSYGDALSASAAVARGLIDLGALPGDRVVILLPNRIEAVWAWLGANAAALIDAPISSDVKGVMLDYYVNDLEPRVVITDRELLARMASATSFRPEVVILVGEDDGERPLGPGVRIVTWQELVSLGSESQSHLPPADPEATATILYTSGTTGPSKGVMLSQGYWAEMSRNHLYELMYDRDDVIYGAQPLCHMDVRSIISDCLFVRCTFVLAARFSASSYWDDVVRHDADKFMYIGTMLHLIFKQPDRQTGQQTKFRIGLGSAGPASIYEDFRARFHCDLLEGYGMTEAPFMTSQIPGRVVPGTVGRIVHSIEGRLVDDDGELVERGTTGELIMRPARRHTMMQGYWRKPEATVAAIRHLWFHTGDLMRELPDGSLQYVGRKKDSIRRRGENVSAWEVEQVVLRDPRVREAAAFGVPSDVGDEDVALLVVATDPTNRIDLPALREQMAADLPRFSLPRYLEQVTELPKTPSERVAKGLVRERGITPAAYDADAHDAR